MQEGAIEIPEALRQMAELYTDARVEANRNYYSIHHYRGRRGKRNTVLFPEEVDAEWLTEYKGILAELIVRNWYDLHGENYKASALVKKMGDSTADIETDNLIVEVKGCERKMRFNRFALEKSNADTVVFVVFTSSNTAQVKQYPVQDVYSWTLVAASEKNQWYEKKPTYESNQSTTA